MTDLRNSFTVLSERGGPRGAASVLDGARSSARRAQRRRQVMVGGVGALAVLSAVIGAAGYVGRDEAQPTFAGAPGDQAPIVTDIRLEAHDGFDRMLIEFDTDRLPEAAGSSGEAPLDQSQGAAAGRTHFGDHCQVGLRLFGDDVPSTSIIITEVGESIAAAPTPNGLPQGLSGPITADTTYVDQLVPLCVDHGKLWYALTYDVPGEITSACFLTNPARIQIDIGELDTDEPLEPCPQP